MVFVSLNLFDSINQLIPLSVIQLSQCFPKSSPQEFLIWSARLKIGAILSYFAIQRVSDVDKLPILWSAEDFLEILGSAKCIPLFYGPQAKKVWETLY